MLQAASIDWLGWALVAILIALLNQQEKARIKHYLAEEVQTGILSDWLYLHSYNKQSQKKLLRETSLRHTSERKLLRRLFQVCAELAHKKWQQDRHGNEITNAERIASLRNSLAILSRQTGSLIHGNTMTHK
ncbi:MAG: hypothetical protein HPY85_04125 [Anaerolineae bacterium]|nr:hypothetical protein [Anaerolineae bacterium]